MMQITLEQLLSKMLNSQRLLLLADTGEELYRGYVANFVHCNVDRSIPVKEISLYTERFRKELREERLYKLELARYPVDNVTDFQYSDLELLIYQKVILEKAQKNS